MGESHKLQALDCSKQRKQTSWPRRGQHLKLHSRDGTAIGMCCLRKALPRPCPGLIFRDSLVDAIMRPGLTFSIALAHLTSPCFPLRPFASSARVNLLLSSTTITSISTHCMVTHKATLLYVHTLFVGCISPLANPSIPHPNSHSLDPD